MPRRSHSYHIVKLKKVKEELEEYKENKFYITSGDVLTFKKDVINVVSYSDGTETDFSFGEKSEDEIYTLSINLVSKVVSLPPFVSVLKCEDVKKIVKIPDTVTWVYFSLDVPKLKKELPQSVVCLKYKGFDSPDFTEEQKLPRLLDFVTMSHVTSLYFKECTITKFVFPPALYEFNALESRIYFYDVFPNSVVRVSISMCTLVNKLKEHSDEVSFDDYSGGLSSEESSKEIGSELPEFEVGSRVSTIIITGSKLTSLPKLKHLHRLHLLRVCENDLEDLPSLPKKLRVLECSYNSLDELPKLPKRLKVLECHVNNIWRFPKFPKELKSLKCSFNYLVNFNLELPEGLINLDIQNCYLSSLPRLPFSLETLRADYNRITRFQYLPPSLVKFNNSDNPNEFVEPLPISPYTDVGDFSNYEVGTIIYPILVDLRRDFGLNPRGTYKMWYRIYWKIRGIIAVKRFIRAFERSRKHRIDLHRRVCELIRLIPGGVDAKPSEVSQGLWVNI